MASSLYFFLWQIVQALFFCRQKAVLPPNWRYHPKGRQGRNCPADQPLSPHLTVILHMYINHRTQSQEFNNIYFNIWMPDCYIYWRWAQTKNNSWTYKRTVCHTRSPPHLILIQLFHSISELLFSFWNTESYIYLKQKFLLEMPTISIRNPELHIPLHIAAIKSY